MITQPYPSFSQFEPRLNQAMDVDGVVDAVREANPKTMLEWFALISGIAAAGMWVWRKVLRGVATNLLEILRIGTTAKLLREGQEKMRESVAIAEARTTLILNNRMDVGIFQSDEKGLCRFANRRMLNVLGGGFEMVEGNNWHGIIAEDDREDVLEEWKRCVETGTDFNMTYHWRRPRDGSLIPVRVWGQRITDEKRVIGWLCEVTFVF